MKLYDILNNAEAVEEQYTLLKQVLEEQLAIEPSKEVTSWYQQWQNRRKRSYKIEYKGKAGLF